MVGNLKCIPLVFENIVAGIGTEISQNHLQAIREARILKNHIFIIKTILIGPRHMFLLS